VSRSRASIVKELNQLMRARADHIRWWGGEPDFMRRTGHRIRLLLAELEKQTDDDERDSDERNG
jgi:hypothetical protein